MLERLREHNAVLGIHVMQVYMYIWPYLGHCMQSMCKCVSHRVSVGKVLALYMCVP